MNVNEIFLFLFLTIILVIAAINDIRLRRIPNWLTYPAMIVAVVYHTGMKGLGGLLFSMEGLGVGIAIMLVIYLVGGTGAGDVKLMGAIGAFLGPKSVLSAFLFTSIVGGVYAIVLLVLNGYLRKTIKRYWLIIKSFFLTKNFLYIPPSEKEKKQVLRYGIAISLGTFISVFLGIKI